MSKKRRPSKPSLISTGINGVGLAIAFNQGIGQALRTIPSGNPQAVLYQVIWGETGLDANTGQLNYQQLGASLASKIVAFVWVKAAHMLTRRLRFRF